VTDESSIVQAGDGERTKRVWLWGIGIGVFALFLAAIGFSFLAPETLLTDAAASLAGKERVEAENAVRASIIQVGGSIIVMGTLALAAWRLMLTDRQLRSMEASAQAAADNARAAVENVRHQRERSRREEQSRWEDKLRDAYADWAAALLVASVANCDVGDATKFDDPEKVRRAKETFDREHFKAETITLRILMMEKRPSLLSALKRIDDEKMPDGPIDIALRGRFWEYLHNDPYLYRDVVGAFLGLMRRRLARLTDLVTDPEIEGFSLPAGDGYRAYVMDEFRKRNLPWP
jgi:hypothetical protein